MLSKYGYILKNIVVLLVISFVMCVVALNYVVDNNIMHYGDLLQGSMTIFGFYLSQTGWIIFLSIIMSVICTIVSSIIAAIIYFLFKCIFKLFKLIKNKVKHV